jgi:phospholipid transport system substrate-binding protein
MKTRFFRIRILFLLIPFLWMGSLAYGESPTEQIRETTDQLLKILEDPALQAPERVAERNRLIRQAVDESFDWVEMSRRTLGRHWVKLSEEERKEFIEVFTDLLERTYLDQVHDYSGVSVNYEGEKVEGEYGTVQVRVTAKETRSVPVTYRVRKDRGNWYVYDVVVEGVSLINNYRTQFNSILVRSSFDDLLERMRARVAEG